MCFQEAEVVELETERRVDAEHGLSSVDVAIHSETLKDTAPVLEGIKVRQSLTRTHTHTHTHTNTRGEQNVF